MFLLLDSGGSINAAVPTTNPPPKTEPQHLNSQIVYNIPAVNTNATGPEPRASSQKKWTRNPPKIVTSNLTPGNNIHAASPTPDPPLQNESLHLNSNTGTDVADAEGGDQRDEPCTPNLLKKKTYI